jgi:hypothetical protein
LTARPALAAIGVALLAVGSARCGGLDRSFESIAFELIERSKPEEGQLTAMSRVRRDDSGVHATWEVETGMEWSAYSELVRRRVPPHFSVVDANGTSLTFRTSMETDVYTLTFEPIASTSRVRATFEGKPH